jgi:hypothetical protein
VRKYAVTDMNAIVRHAPVSDLLFVLFGEALSKDASPIINVGETFGREDGNIFIASHLC